MYVTFKTSKRPRKVHLKLNSTLNHDLNVELTFRDLHQKVRTAGYTFHPKKQPS